MRFIVDKNDTIIKLQYGMGDIFVKLVKLND